MEGGVINKSLLALKECVRADNDQVHIPFRGRKLIGLSVYIPCSCQCCTFLVINVFVSVLI
ncbi:putative kinesin-like protein [Helianthus annuus]|nr:putative kinesin-like protein [Helianthus annuus]